MKLRYRPEIDGLRALAVSIVILFHAGLGCTGGYVGVDVFFVISGFLISSLILADLESGCFTFANFWERRARRILPALTVVLIATAITGWFLLLPADFENLGRAMASQAVFGSNLYHWRTSGYFSPAAEEKPLLHTWSLAVEEQFYLICPFVIWALFYNKWLRGRTALMIAMSVGFVLSLTVSIYGVTRYPSSTFYLLPTRAWELLLGALVAVCPANFAVFRRRDVREIVSLTGIAGILCATFSYDGKTAFPGFAALLPCLGTAAVIWANQPHANVPLTIVGSLLSLRPLVWVGLISYSLYLWHWPLLAYARYLAIQPLSLPVRVLAVVVAFLLAILSYRYVETPFRKRRWGTSQRSLFCLSGTAITTAFGCGLICLAMHGFPNRFPLQTRQFADARSDTGGFLRELSTHDVQAENLIEIGTNDSSRPPQLLVWGDSHAMAALPAFDAFLKEAGVSGRAATHSSTPPLLDWCFVDKYGLGEQSRDYNDAVYQYIQKYRISEVCLVAYWCAYQDENGNYSEAFNQALLRTVHRLADIGARPTILLDNPVHPFDVPKSLTRFTVSHDDIRAHAAKPDLAMKFDGIPVHIIAEIEAAGGRVLDCKPGFLDWTGRHYMTHSNDFAYYRDHGHLSSRGALAVLLPFYRQSLLQDSILMVNRSANRTDNSNPTTHR